jgi:hypothetical protein
MNELPAKAASAQLSWPLRFRVTVVPRTGPSQTLNVLTWLNRDKAVALATAEFLRRHGDGAQVYRIEVDEMGPADRDLSGLVVTEGYLHDRDEF